MSGFINRVAFNGGTGKVIADDTPRKEYLRDINNELLRDEIDRQKDKVKKLVRTIEDFAKSHPDADISELQAAVVAVQDPIPQP